MPALTYCTARRRLHRGPAHPPPQLVAEDGRGRLLDELLVPALDGALALAQVHDVALAVRHHLDLDVAGLLQYFSM